MAYNPIQFQHGMSLPEFLQAFGTECACCEAVLRARWPAGFSCPRCGGTAHCILFSLGRPLFQCHACHRQTSLTAGTLFASTKLPLTTWFLAIYLVSQAKTGLSALQLKRDIGVSYPTAWLMHHKIMAAMAARETSISFRARYRSTTPTSAASAPVASPVAARRTRSPLLPPSRSMTRGIRALPS